jgi:glyoxylase-like metal-dependent hydrolase (beta-lactamase superfamily II)
MMLYRSGASVMPWDREDGVWRPIPSQYRDDAPVNATVLALAADAIATVCVPLTVTASPGATRLDACGAVRRLVQAGVSPSEVGTVLLSHLHFDHTADLGFEVSAASVEVLFERAALALVDTMVRRRLVRERERRVVEARGDDEGELLVGLRSEIVFLLDVCNGCLAE